MRKRVSLSLFTFFLLWVATSAVLAATGMERRVAACTHCHGDQGRATPDGYYPRIAGKPVAYLYSQLLGFRDGRRTHPAMVSIVSGLSDAYLYEMALHFSMQNPPYAAVLASAEKPAVLALGQRIALKGSADGRVPACISCHGQTLTGLDPVMPGLLGLSKDYLNAQLGAWSNGARKAASPDCMADIVKRMQADELSAVSAWLSAQPVSSKPRADMTGKKFPLECGTHRAPTAQSEQNLRSDFGLLKPGASQSARNGAYLATLGNCAGCHSVPGKPAYSGGRGIETPYGVVYANNITPDPSTGLGKWNADDFYRALTQGVSRDGHRLYPAFPWPYYVRFSRSESDDLFAFLQQLPPVSEAPQPARLQFPYSWRPLVAVWSGLNSVRQPSASGSMAADSLIARGEWLVNGPGHCGACHTPKGVLGLDDANRHLGGADMPRNGWHAPALGGAADRPLDGTTGSTNLARYLHAGADDMRMAAGPMAQVIGGSLQFWTTSDIAAAAAYLTSLAQPAAFARTTGRGSVNAAELEKSLFNGKRIYKAQCADCHGEDGRGQPGQAPALVWTTAAGTVGATPLPNAARAILHGGYAPATAGNPRPYGMPPFRNDLSSQAIADVLTWMALEWKVDTVPVTAADVERYRGSLNGQH